MDLKRNLIDHSILRLVQIALTEDIGTGDLTSEALVDANDLARGALVARSAGVIAGTPIAGLVFREVDRTITCEWSVEEGSRVEADTILCQLHGPAQAILTAERTALNFLQRMSGVATITRRFVDAIEGTKATILDTRKTIPGWRLLDKYSVAMGGGANHRIGLYDMVMIKDNHIATHGSIAGAVAAVRRFLADRGLEEVPIEVETDSLEQVSEALSCEGVSRIMFDNFPIETMRQAVMLVGDRCQTEASGNVSLATVREIAETGVQFISSGTLTHSAPALDIALDMHRS